MKSIPKHVPTLESYVEAFKIRLEYKKTFINPFKKEYEFCKTY